MAKAQQIEGLEPQLAYAEAAALALTVRTKEMVDHSREVLSMTEIENVHDMRVASRRLRAALEIFAPCFDAKEHAQVLGEVKAIADALGERRDRDVAIEALEGYAGDLGEPKRAGIESLIGSLRSEQLRANHELEAFVTEERLQVLSSRVRELARSARERLR
ncbi:hypothetical protein BH10ACT11_BH10ACT11_13220 [soil metagenome]